MSKRNWIVVAVAAVWWTLEGLVTTGQLLTMQWPSDELMTVGKALRRGLLSAWLWIPLSVALFWLVERFPIERGRLASSLTVLSTATVGLVLLRALSIWAFNPWLGWYRELPPFGDVLVTSIWNNFLMAWLNIGVAHGWLYAQRARQRERQAEQLQARLTETRLEALSAQLNPHFLFNALNSIAEMVHRDADAADRMLVGLGELLRSSLDYRQGRLVPLREELRLLQHYLEIEKVRLGERLQLQWDIGPGLDDALVPPLLLQPLAENAIRHAIAAKIAPGHLGVRVGGEGAWLLLEISDDGDGGPATDRQGTGLSNIRARLECLYGDRQSLQLQARPDGGTRACLRLPLQRGRRAA
ncbi:sensor histidine kinase [Luteimonas aquatica]|uniref:sensor histidine kinase n=1 Tax=Luteimonas aquatica TaxID=450364 RepID=UPI001F565C31|nr:histidine kinase [Luteimonas aquatica]